MTTIQGCVTNEDVGCPLDPLVVVAPPPELPPCDACNHYPGGGGDGGGGEWGGGTGGGGTPPVDEDGDGDTLDEGPGAFTLCVAMKLGVSGWSSISGTAVTAYMAWDARRNSRNAYDDWAGYRRSVDAGYVQYDIHINDLYYARWKDAEHQEKLMYAATAAAAVWAGTELFKAAIACAPYGAAPV